MKKIILTTATTLLITFSFAQKDFKWETVDSVAKTKTQIYSDTKLFIAQQWNSAKDVIQNDDKDGGVILIKGTLKYNVTYFMGARNEYYYAYNVTFKMKENKFKIIIDNVHCDKAFRYGGDGKCYGEATCIEPYEGIENCPESGTFAHPGPTKDKLTALMPDIKRQIQTIFNNYLESIKKQGGW